jgi:hypothetical protein
MVAKLRIGATAPDVGATTPDIGATAPDIGATTPDIGATAPQIGGLAAARMAPPATALSVTIERFGTARRSPTYMRPSAARQIGVAGPPSERIPRADISARFFFVATTLDATLDCIAFVRVIASVLANLRFSKLIFCAVFFVALSFKKKQTPPPYILQFTFTFCETIKSVSVKHHSKRDFQSRCC